jgi:hypothetical protein
VAGGASASRSALAVCDGLARDVLVLGALERAVVAADVGDWKID